MRLMIFAALAVVASAPAVSANEYSSLDDALEDLRQRRPLVGKVSPQIAAEAAAAVANAESGELQYLIAVVKDARDATSRPVSQTPLAAALMARFSSDPFAEPGILEFVLDLRAEDTLAASTESTDWLEALELVFEESGYKASSARRLLAQHGDGETVASLLEVLSESTPPHRSAGLFLTELRHAGQVEQVVEVLTLFDPVDVGLARSRDATLKTLLRSERASLHVISMLRERRTSPGLYRALGYLPGKQARRVKKHLGRQIADETGETLAAALESAGRLGAPGLLDVALSAVAQSGPAQVVALQILTPMAKSNPDVLEPARSAAADLLSSGTGDALATAIRSSVALGIAEDELSSGDLLAWINDPKQASAVRLAALGALKAVGTPVTRDLLLTFIRLLGDRDPRVSQGARVTLISHSGMRFPRQAAPWLSWLQRQEFDAVGELVVPEAEEVEEDRETEAERLEREAQERKERERRSRESQKGSGGS